jgi:hypothetical protein
MHCLYVIDSVSSDPRSSGMLTSVVRKLVTDFRDKLTVLSSKVKAFFSDFLTSKMGPIDCPETSATNDLSTLRNIPEGRRSHLHRGESLKSSNSFSSLKIYTTFCIQQFGSGINALF